MATRKPWELEPGPFTVYHLLAADSELLYVGHSSNPEYRILQHAQNLSAGWTRRIDHWRFFGPFSTRGEAKLMELQHIMFFHPPWNAAQDGGGKIPFSVTAVLVEIQRRMEACTLSMSDALEQVMCVTGDTPLGAAKRLNLRRDSRRTRTVEAIVAHNFAEAAWCTDMRQYFTPHHFVLKNGRTTAELLPQYR